MQQVQQNVAIIFFLAYNEKNFEGGRVSTENFILCLSAVLPMFIIMSMGYVSKRVGFIRGEDVPRFNKVIFNAFMPFLVFYNLYSSDLSVAIRPAMLLFAVGAVLVVYVVTAAAVLLTVKDGEKRGVMIQGIYRSNYVVVGLPIAAAFLPPAELGAISVLIAVIVPVYNTLAVITLEVFRGGRPPLGRTLLSVLTNPLIIGAAAGLLLLQVDIRLPDILERVVRDVAAVGTPVQLFLLGAFFRFKGLGRYKKELLWAVLGRLVLVPAAVLPLGALLGFRGAEFVALIGCFASSNAVSSFTMTQQMGGDDELAGDIVVLTSALCAVTVFGWAFLFKSLGLF